MLNPFIEYKDYPLEKKETALDKLLRSRNLALGHIIEGYKKLLEEEVKSLVWLVEHNRIIKAYSIAEESVKNMEYGSVDIEDFCYELENSEKMPYLINGPAGLYLSALCNYAKEKEINLKLGDLRQKIHLIGYKLPEGKSLIIEGDLGDFIGVGLEGGEITVKGSVSDWLGAGMKRGKIVVKKDTGGHTGEWMMGGEIWVEGRIRGLGRLVKGKIYEKNKPVVPSSYDLSH